MKINNIQYGLVSYTNRFISGIEWTYVSGIPRAIDYGSDTPKWEASVILQGTVPQLEELIEMLENNPNDGDSVVVEDYEFIFGPEIDETETITAYVTKIGTISQPLERLSTVSITLLASLSLFIKSGDEDIPSVVVSSIDREHSKAFVNTPNISGISGSDFIYSSPTCTVSWYVKRSDAEDIRRLLINARGASKAITARTSETYLFDRDNNGIEVAYIVNVGSCVCNKSGEWFTLSATFVKANKLTVIPDQFFIDFRDSGFYRTITIGTKTFMAENFRGDFGNNWSYDNDAGNRVIYGRLYDWASYISSAPAGWHPMTEEEANILINYVGGLIAGGRRLKANSALWTPNTGKDTIRFSGLPAGYRKQDGVFSVLHEFTGLWCEQYNTLDGKYLLLDISDATRISHTNKLDALSARYVKD